MDRQHTNIFKPRQLGQEIDLRKLFDQYYNDLCLYALKYVGSFEKAEDVVQEVYINLWENNRIRNIKGSVRAYLYTSVRNNSLNYIRKNHRYQYELIDTYLGDLLEEPDEAEDFEEKTKKLYIELAKLSPKSRKVFDAVVFQNMKYREAAETMGVSINTIKTYLSRAMKQLRKSMTLFSFLP